MKRYLLKYYQIDGKECKGWNVYGGQFEDATVAKAVFVSRAEDQESEEPTTGVIIDMLGEGQDEDCVWTATFGVHSGQDEWMSQIYGQPTVGAVGSGRTLTNEVLEVHGCHIFTKVLKYMDANHGVPQALVVLLVFGKKDTT